MRLLLLLVLGGACLLLAACGSGGTSSSAERKGLAVMQVYSPTATSSIAAISATLTIPFGVTVKTDPADPFQPAGGVVELRNAPPSGTLVFARYSAATSYKMPESGQVITYPGKLKFSVIDVNGFAATEQILLHLDVTPGYFPQAGDFSLLNSSFSDINGAVMVGVTPTLTTTIQ